MLYFEVPKFSDFQDLHKAALTDSQIENSFFAFKVKDCIYSDATIDSFTYEFWGNNPKNSKKIIFQNVLFKGTSSLPENIRNPLSVQFENCFFEEGFDLSPLHAEQLLFSKCNLDQYTISIHNLRYDLKKISFNNCIINSISTTINIHNVYIDKCIVKESFDMSHNVKCDYFSFTGFSKSFELCENKIEKCIIKLSPYIYHTIKGKPGLFRKKLEPIERFNLFYNSIKSISILKYESLEKAFKKGGDENPTQQVFIAQIKSFQFHHISSNNDNVSIQNLFAESFSFIIINRGGDIRINELRFNHFELVRTQNLNGVFQILSLHPLSEKGHILFDRCNLKGVGFHDIDFINEIKLSTSKLELKNAECSGISFPKSIKIFGRVKKFEIWKQFRLLAEKNAYPIEAAELRAKETKSYFEETKKDKWEDKRIVNVLWLNNYGESWVKPLLYTLITIPIFSILLINIEFLNPKVPISCDIFVEIFSYFMIQLMNPVNTSTLSAKGLTVCGSIAHEFWFPTQLFYLIFKVLISIGYFQTIVAFRKFFRKA